MLRRTQNMNWFFFLVILCIVTVPTQVTGSESGDRGLNCDDRSDHSPLVSHCEIREQTIQVPAGTLHVDGHTNGGVSIKGWDRNEILIRARVQTVATSKTEALQLAREIRVESSNAQIHAEGPTQENRRHWSVSYEVLVPRHCDLSLKTHNGGISVSEVGGKIEFSAINGGVSLNRLGGTVHGSTTNGGLSINLSGDRWEGEGMDVWTTNGGVSILVPEKYSARLETGTVNGGLNMGFPVTVQGRLNKELSVQLGSGGPTVRARTTNGGVSVQRKG